MKGLYTMAKLYFKYGVMGSSKTANALMTDFNYREKGNNVLLIKPSIDTRDDEYDEKGNRITKLRSRIGLEAIADVITPEESFFDVLAKRQEYEKIDVIIVDEAQFLQPKQVEELKHISVFQNIPVLCFGLRTDFRTRLFPGSQRLMELASNIQEIKHVCTCAKKAEVNAKIDGMTGEVITEGEQIDIGGDEKYESMCWKCWYEKIYYERKK